MTKKNDKNWELLCAMDGHFCSKKVIKKLRQQLCQMEATHEENADEIEKKIQDYFRRITD